MTDPNLVSIEVAGQLSGVTSRSLRRWIASGRLPAVSGKRGRLVSLADIARIADESGHIIGHSDMSGGQGAGQSGSMSESVTTPTIAPTAMARLEAIRDQWLAPLVDRIGTLERENGRLEERLTTTETERDALQSEIERLKINQEDPTAPPEVRSEEKAANVGQESLQVAGRPWWKKLLGIE